MANVPPTFKHIIAQGDPSTPNWKSLRHVYEQVAKVINGKLSLGQTANQANNTIVPCDNLDAVSAYYMVTAAANTDFAITHNLGRIPSGYLVVGKFISCDIFTGVAAWTTTQIFLQSSVALAANRLKIMIW